MLILNPIEHIPVDEAELADPGQCIIDLYDREARYTNAPQRPQIAGSLGINSLRSHVRARQGVKG